MKLISAQIDSFGKLKNFRFDFNEGMNVLRENNGFGKTTLATFIKAMFYGIGSSKKTDLAQNDHKHFQPFNSTAKFGGSLRFEHSGRHFRVERFFGNTPREHTFKLYDDDSNKLLQSAIDEKTGELGFRLFGLDAEAFERCLYLPQKDVVIASNDSFMQRLSNLAENTTEQNNCRKACETLTKFYKLFKLDKGEGGALYELRCKREQKMRELQENKLVKNKIDSLNQSILSTTQEYMQADLQRQETEQQLYAVQQKQRELSNVSAVYGVEELLRQRKQEQAELIVELKKLQDEVPQQPTLPTPPQKTEVEQPAKKSPLMPFGIICAVLALGGVALAIADNLLFGGNPFALFGGIPFALLGGVSAILLSKAIKDKNKKEEVAQQEKAKFEAQQEKYQTELVEYQKNIGAYQEYTVKTENARTRLSAVEFAIADLMEQLKQLAPQGADSLLQEEKRLKIQQDELRNNLEKQTQRCAILKNRLAEDRKELSVREERFVLPSATEGEIENITEQMAQGQKKYGYAKKAIELLLQAKQNLTQSYLPKLNRLLNENLSKLSNFDFEEATVDSNFEVLVRQGGQLRELGYLSTGCRQLCQFALRISLMQCIFGGELPLLVLDDPFVNFDSQNFASAYGLLQSLATNTQILYLTCHDR